MRTGVAPLVGLMAFIGASCASATPDQVDADADTDARVIAPPDAGPIPTDSGLSPTDVATYGESTARVRGIACGRSTEGSGFAIAEDLLVTNAHVVVGLEHPTIERLDDRVLDGTVVAWDEVTDLAIIHVPGADFPPLSLREPEPDTVGALFGWEPGPVLEPTPFRVSQRLVVRIEAVASDERIERRSLLVAADIDVGDSGGALIDSDGNVVGVVYARRTEDSGAGYAVRIDELEELAATVDRARSADIAACGG